MTSTSLAGGSRVRPKARLRTLESSRLEPEATGARCRRAGDPTGLLLLAALETAVLEVVLVARADGAGVAHGGVEEPLAEGLLLLRAFERDRGRGKFRVRGYVTRCQRSAGTVARGRGILSTVVAGRGRVGRPRRERGRSITRMYGARDVDRRRARRAVGWRARAASQDHPGGRGSASVADAAMHGFRTHLLGTLLGRGLGGTLLENGHGLGGAHGAGGAGGGGHHGGADEGGHGEHRFKSVVCVVMTTLDRALPCFFHLRTPAREGFVAL